MEAKCTIDTGNMQGNIVSRAFVEELGYSESSFHKLTNAEKEGGTGITGHKLTPEGAVYLTWYHNKSTRVFRDMRFLISQHPMYDLIIGARSIQKNNILDVPNLMIASVSRTHFKDNQGAFGISSQYKPSTKTNKPIDPKETDKRDQKLKEHGQREELISKLEEQLAEAEADEDTELIEELHRKLAEYEEIYDTTENKPEDNVPKVQGDGDKAPPYKEPDEPLGSKILPSTTGSSGVFKPNMAKKRNPPNTPKDPKPK